MGKGSLPACLCVLQPSLHKHLVGASPRQVLRRVPGTQSCTSPSLLGVHTLGKEQQCQQIHPVRSGECSWGGMDGAPRDPNTSPGHRQACSKSRLLSPTPGRVSQLPAGASWNYRFKKLVILVSSQVWEPVLGRKNSN